MSEKPLSRRVHVEVIPRFETDPDSADAYFVSLELNHLELQLKGNSFVAAARRALKRTLKGGQIRVFSDRRSVKSQNNTVIMDKPRIVSFEDVKLTTIWHPSNAKGMRLRASG